MGIAASAQDNLLITYKDPLTKVQSLTYKNWKMFLLIGISDWHMIKIQTNGPNILIAKRFGQEFQEYKITDRTSYGLLRTEPHVVEPEGLPQARINKVF